MTYKTGILLVNLGTPDAPSISSIRAYLREFLMDERVLDIPKLLRGLLVYGFILPFRPYKTAKAYRAIWQKQGSPLRIQTQALEKALRQTLDHSYQVSAAMRYGNPSIEKGLEALKGCQEIIVLPLFPQYSSAATGSAIAQVLGTIQRDWNIPKLTVLNHFYREAGFIEAYVKLIQPYVKDPDTFLLLSYHSLPERHLTKSHCKADCDRSNPCPPVTDTHPFCYRAQCYETSGLIVKGLSLNPDRCMTTFQSRLGRIPWVQPYTDQQLHKLRKLGVEKLVVSCPSFVADCLETLEEIGIGLRQQWQALGGTSFSLVPCPNTTDTWVNALTQLIRLQQSLKG